MENDSDGHKVISERIISVEDENGNMLPSRYIRINDSKNFILKLKNTDEDVYEEKVFVVLNGKQYDLNKNNTDSKTAVLKNNNKEMMLDLNFDDLENGKYYGIFIIDDQRREKSSFLENQGNSRFMIDKSIKASSEKSEVFTNGFNKSDLPVERLRYTLFEKEINKVIDFAVFTNEQVSNNNFTITNHNTFKSVDRDKTVYYAYIYNDTEYETNYAIGLVAGDEIIFSKYTDDNIVLKGKKDAIFKIKVPTEKIENYPHYFILVSNPLSEIDSNSIEGEKESYNTNISFSQKFILEK